MLTNVRIKIAQWRSQEVEASVKDESVRRLQMALQIIRDTTKSLINRGNLMGVRPSLPGEPPKKVSGQLFNSIQTRIIVSGAKYVGTVFTNVEYALRLEYGFVGTDVLGRSYDQAPRPFMRPGLEKSLPAVKSATGLAFKTE
jgi:hypothetical protein